MASSCAIQAGTTWRSGSRWYTVCRALHRSNAVLSCFSFHFKVKSNVHRLDAVHQGRSRTGFRHSWKNGVEPAWNTTLSHTAYNAPSVFMAWKRSHMRASPPAVPGVSLYGGQPCPDIIRQQWKHLGCLQIFFKLLNSGGPQYDGGDSLI